MSHMFLSTQGQEEGIMARAATSSVLHPDVAVVLFDALGAADFLQEKLFPGMYVCPDKLQKLLKRPSVHKYLDGRPSKLRKLIHLIAWALKERTLWRKLAHGYSEDGKRSFAGGLHIQVLEPWTKCASDRCRHKSLRAATQSAVAGKRGRTSMVAFISCICICMALLL